MKNENDSPARLMTRIGAVRAELNDLMVNRTRVVANQADLTRRLKTIDNTISERKGAINRLEALLAMSGSGSRSVLMEVG